VPAGAAPILGATGVATASDVVTVAPVVVASPVAEAARSVDARPHVVIPGPRREEDGKPEKTSESPHEPEHGRLPRVRSSAEPAPAADTHRSVVPESERVTLTELVAIDGEHDSFFRSLPPVAMDDDELALELPTDPKLELKRRPEVRARRARLTRYVQWTVGSLAVVCMVAMVKVSAGGLRHSHAAAPSPLAAAAVAVSAPPLQTSPPPTAPGVAAPAASSPVTEARAVAQATPSSTPASSAPVSSAPVSSALASSAPVSSAPVSSASAEPTQAAPAIGKKDPQAAPTKTAADEKRDAQRALDRGAFAKAAEAAARSVAIDATDGEAWLILGAAYQSLGKMADARSAFLSCTKDGKRGPVGECRAMLR
jgi:hypothetical protein